MEELTFANYQEKASKAVLSKAKKMTPRDLVEASPNNFLAYVDDGNESFDVSIEFEKEEIKSIECDCPNNTSFCAHKVALINQIINKKPATLAKKNVPKKKQSEAEILLRELDESELRLWASELLSKNQDISFLFINQFSKQKVEFTKDEIKSIIEQAIKSVIKNKKKIDATELKKIIEALEVALTPFVEFCKANINNQETYELLIFTNNTLFDFHLSSRQNSVKTIRFIEKIYKEINHSIHKIQDHAAWLKQIENTIGFLVLNQETFTTNNATIFHLYNSIDSENQKSQFAKLLFDFYETKRKTKFIAEIKLFLITVFAENGLFINVYNEFTPIKFDNNYNLFLIEKLIEIEKYEHAEIYAQQQIAINSKEKYNLDYYRILQKIYSITEDESKIANLQMRLIFYDFSIDNYQLIKKHCNEKQFDTFRKKLLSHFKREFYSEDEYYVNAFFEILFFEREYKLMIENINTNANFQAIYKYKEALFEFDKVNFLKTIFNLDLGNFYFNNKELIAEYKEKFIIWIKGNYDEKTVLEQIAKLRPYQISSFVQDLMKKYTQNER